MINKSDFIFNEAKKKFPPFLKESVTNCSAGLEESKIEIKIALFTNSRLFVFVLQQRCLTKFFVRGLGIHGPGDVTVLGEGKRVRRDWAPLQVQRSRVQCG